MWSALQLAESARRGTWPVAGGVLDQTLSFYTAALLVWQLDDHYRAKHRVPTMNF